MGLAGCRVCCKDSLSDVQEIHLIINDSQNAIHSVLLGLYRKILGSYICLLRFFAILKRNIVVVLPCNLSIVIRFSYFIVLILNLLMVYSSPMLGKQDCFWRLWDISEAEMQVSVKVGNEHLPMAVTVLEKSDVDLLFGLDMLRRYRCNIDLANNCLKFGILEDTSLEFLPDHEIPNREHPQTGVSKPIILTLEILHGAQRMKLSL